MIYLWLVLMHLWFILDNYDALVVGLMIDLLWTYEICDIYCDICGVCDIYVNICGVCDIYGMFVKSDIYI